MGTTLMNTWLVKSEPSTWSFTDQIEKQTAMWDGVRNYQAANNLKSMKCGDLCLFYHSITGKEIVGLIRVTREAYPDPTDKTNRFVVVDVTYEALFKKPVTLEQIKHDDRLNHLPLIKQSRLSVMPIDQKSFDLICQLGEPVP